MKALAFSGGKDSMACLHLFRNEIDFAIYVDTGKSYPETRAMVRYAETIVPVATVRSDRDAQNARDGIPSEIVPVDYTTIGQIVTGTKPVKIQSYLDCCFHNIASPLFMKAVQLGATSIIYGQRKDDSYKSPAKHGDVVHGILRLHPIEEWTSGEVLAYLESVMDVPEHYRIGHSSLDCYDCTAFRNSTQDRVLYTKNKYPEFHREYQERLALIRQAMENSGYMEKEHA